MMVVKKKIGIDKLQISEFNTAFVGTYRVRSTYKNKALDINLKVTNNQEEVYNILRYELSQSTITHNSNKSEKKISLEVNSNE